MASETYLVTYKKVADPCASEEKSKSAPKNAPAKKGIVVFEAWYGVIGREVNVKGKLSCMLVKVLNASRNRSCACRDRSGPLPSRRSLGYFPSRQRYHEG